MKARKKGRWIRERQSDPYVKRARAEGFRSRAAYKLLSLDAREGLLRRGATVVDLGAAPGGWSQVAVRRVGPQGRVFALDILPMEPLPGIEFIRGDIRAPGTREALRARLGDRRADLVLSDMAPELSGVNVVDQARSVALAELAHDFARAVLHPGGALLLKAFQGPDLPDFRRGLTLDFERVSVCKPPASRARSAEIYLLAQGFRSIV